MDLMAYFFVALNLKNPFALSKSSTMVYVGEILVVLLSQMVSFTWAIIGPCSIMNDMNILRNVSNASNILI